MGLPQDIQRQTDSWLGIAVFVGLWRRLSLALALLSSSR